MKNVLVVDDEETLILIIESKFEEYKDHFNVLTARNGQEAVQILESNVIDFVVTDLNMPIMGGIELLAYMSTKFPTVPAIAMTAFSTPEVEDTLAKMGTLRLLDKPVDLDVLAHTVMEGLARSHQGGTLSCISVSNFIQLINMEEKTCVVEVHGEENQRGFLYFNQGDLYDASLGELKGEPACYEMIAWDNVQLYLKEPPREKTPKRITKGIMSLVLEGVRLKDEAAASELRKLSGSDPAAEVTDEYAIDELNQELEAIKQEALPENREATPERLSPVKIVGTAEAEFIGKIFKIISSHLRDEALLQAVFVEVQALIPFDLAVILTLEKSRSGFLKVDFVMAGGETAISRGAYHRYQGSIFAGVLKKNAPRIVDDTGALSSRVEKEFLVKNGIKSCLLVPLTSDGVVTGLVLLAAKKTGMFGDVQNLAEWITVGISLASQRKRLSAEIIRRKQALEATKRIGRALVLWKFDIDRVLKFSMEAVRLTMGVEAGSLMLRIDNKLKVAHSFNTKGKSIKNFRLKMGQGIAGYVASRGKPVIVNDTRKSPRFFSGIDKITRFKSRSALCVPLGSEKKVTGVIQVLNKIAGDFNSGDQEFLQAIADAVSTAMDTAGCYKQALTKAEYEQDVRRTLQEFLVKGALK